MSIRFINNCALLANTHRYRSGLKAFHPDSNKSIIGGSRCNTVLYMYFSICQVMYLKGKLVD